MWFDGFAARPPSRSEGRSRPTWTFHGPISLENLVPFLFSSIAFFFHSSVGSFLCVCVFSFNQSNQSDQSRHRQWTAVDQLGVPGRWLARPIGFVRIDSIGIRRSFHEIPLATDSTGLTGSIRSAFDWTLMSFFFSHSLIDSTSRLTRLSQFGSI